MSFPRYESYKGSGIEWLGEVPEHWEVRRLKYIANVYLSNVDKHTIDGQKAVNLCNYVDVYKNDRITSEIDFMRATASDEQIERLSLQKEDIIITKDSEDPSDIGVPALMEENIPELVCGYHLAIVRPSSSVGRFLNYLFQSMFVRSVFEVQATGLTRYALGKYSIENLAFAIPYFKEQIGIAAFLDRETAKIDALIAEQQRLIELLKEKRQAVISHAVTKGLNPDAPMKDSGIEWLGEVPEHWDIKRLKHIKALSPNAFVDGPFGSNLKSEHFIDDGDAYVIESNFATQGRLETSGLKTITSEHFETIRRSETRPGDIIIAKIGAQFGKASILPSIDKPAVVSGNSMKLTANKHICETLWVYWQLFNLKANGEIDLLVNGSAQPALSLGAMNELVFLLPSIKEQREITLFLGHETAKFDELTTEAQTAITLLQERRTALISAAVTGKIDVRGLAEAQPEKEAAA